MSPGHNVPHDETGCSPGAREQGVLDTVVGDQVIHACFLAPMDCKISEIEMETLETLITPLTRSGIALRSCRDCRVKVFGRGCLLSAT